MDLRTCRVSALSCGADAEHNFTCTLVNYSQPCTLTTHTYTHTYLRLALPIFENSLSLFPSGLKLSRLYVSPFLASSSPSPSLSPPAFQASQLCLPFFLLRLLLLLFTLQPLSSMALRHSVLVRTLADVFSTERGFDV